MRYAVAGSFSALLMAAAIVGSVSARSSGARALIGNTCHTVEKVGGEYSEHYSADSRYDAYYASPPGHPGYFEYYGADGRYVAYYASSPRHTEYDSWIINKRGDLCLRFVGGNWCYLVKMEERNVIMTNRRTGLVTRCQLVKGNPLQLGASSRLPPLDPRANFFQITKPA
jgi:hypothetical protein